MIDDPIVAEVRRAREEIFRRCGSDLTKLGAFLKQRRKENRLKVVRLTRGRAKPTRAQA